MTFCSCGCPAIIVNVGRGTTVDDGLRAAVAAGRIRAGLMFLPKNPYRHHRGGRCRIRSNAACRSNHPQYLLRAAEQQAEQMQFCRWRGIALASQ